MASKVALILGSGPNIGAHVAKAFAAKGYQVAVASRTKNHQLGDEYLSIQSDFSQPDNIVDIFSTVRKQLGQPSVVIYNAASHISSDPPNDPLALPLSSLNKTIAINITSAYVAAQQAVQSFRTLSPDASRTFIYTGNITNQKPLPPLLASGIGKAAAAHLMSYVSEVYKDFKFYYADERKENGAPVYSAIDGEAAAQFYVELAGSSTQKPWLATFVKGMGYKDFSQKL